MLRGAMTDDDEISPGGSKFVRHRRVESELRLGNDDAEAIDAIEAHVAKHIGRSTNVFHEMVSDLVHIDVHVIFPTPARNCYTLFTTGMSDRPMRVDDGVDAPRFAELTLSLPPDWSPGAVHSTDVSSPALWPVRLLKSLARMPHAYDTWIGFGHTIPNGDPPMPYAPGVEFSCALIVPPVNVPLDFLSLEVRKDKTVHFYAVVPLHESEMHFKLQNGTDALTDLFDDHSVTELLDPKRPPVTKYAKPPRRQ
jgi:hypothetical protein